MEQIERICRMEQLFSWVSETIESLPLPAEEHEKINKAINVLSEYYSSDEWRQDFAADEQGKLPKELKRGVLSEDGIWNLLSTWREIQEEIKIR